MSRLSSVPFVSGALLLVSMVPVLLWLGSEERSPRELAQASPSNELLTAEPAGMLAPEITGPRLQAILARAGKQGPPDPEAGAPPARTGSRADGPGEETTEGEDEDATEGEDDTTESSERAEAGRVEKPEKPRPGLPVTHPLLHEKCTVCHEQNDEGHMTRISYLRKTPEGWELSLKRMLRLYSVELTPEEAKEIVRYLANDHGLARSEAERSLYEVERRVHWSEDEHDEELRETCGKCHTLGRVLSERRDAKEWKLLKATHLAMFPLADWQAFRGRARRGGGEIDWASLSEAEAEEERERLEQRPKNDRADKVLTKLSQDLPLFTADWKTWSVNRREVPVAGSWIVIGHEIGRGDVRGELTIRRVGADSYETDWLLRFVDGPIVKRTGKGILYAGFSWRGRSQTFAPTEPPELREVLLLSDDWTRFQGRIFTGGYNELGMDVTLCRVIDSPDIFAVEYGELMIPSTKNTIEILGCGFPTDLKPEDFHLGEGVTVTAARRLGADRVELGVDVDRKAERGRRMVSFRSVRGPEGLVLYDTVDYIKIVPEEGLARVGGKMRPKQHERFEAVAMNRGADDEPYTDDDYRISTVPAQWKLEEFPIRENDDDVRFVGAIDAQTGVFTPALDGPNPDRRWEANNIGDVYVVASASLMVQELPPKKKKEKEPAEEGTGESGEAGSSGVENGKTEDETPPPIKMVVREFRARGHLLVMVPIYVQWDRYEWESR